MLENTGFFNLFSNSSRIPRTGNAVQEINKASAFFISSLDEISKIPYGKTKSYKQVAEKIKQPKAARAVGRASGANRIPIIVPCHRVVGSSGELVGYSGGGGLLFKSYLQLLEKK